MRTSPPARCGFTIIELLVTIAIISVLCAILLPAVQQAREAAARMTCQNNLKQLGLAIHNFENAHGHLPPSINRISGEYKSWVVYILPYIEQGTLANQYVMEKDWFDAANQRSVGTKLKTMQCPSAPGPRDVVVTAPDGSTFTAATGDYAIHEQLDTAIFTAGLLPLDSSRRGLFAPLYSPTQVVNATSVKGPTLVADCKDGLTCTLMLSEEAGRPQSWRSGTRQATDLNITTPKTSGAWAATLGSLNIQPVGHTRDGVLTPGDCAVNCANNMGVYSFHTGLANICLGDGSVRSLGAELDIYVFYALSTAQGSEILGADDF